jgi:phage head maturation protease
VRIPCQVIIPAVTITPALYSQRNQENRRGLREIASVADARASGLLGGGKVDGLSFGYRVREAKSAGGLRELVELDLVEVSLVANPMQPKARVHAVERRA